MLNVGRNIGKSLTALSACVLFSSAAFAANDPDSFGRPVKYLDVGSAQTIIYYTGTFPCPTGALCKQVTTPQVSQTFNETDRIVINLPANSTNSLLCFSYSPYLSHMFVNSTTGNLAATYSHMGNVTLESSVLANPFLINKITGQPFNGSISMQGVGYHSMYRSILPNTSDRQVLQFSRECINGLLNTQSLQTNYGLTLAQAQSVMRSAMTLRFSTSTSVGFTGYLSSGLGVRLFGD